MTQVVQTGYAAGLNTNPNYVIGIQQWQFPGYGQSGYWPHPSYGGYCTCNRCPCCNKIVRTQQPLGNS